MEKYCKKCGAPILNGVNFCGKCGEPVEDTSSAEQNVVCKKCGQVFKKEFGICPACGTAVDEASEKYAASPVTTAAAEQGSMNTAASAGTNAENIPYVNEVKPQVTMPAGAYGVPAVKKKGSAVKKIIIAAVCILLAAAITVSVFWLLPEKKMKRGDFAIYIKDNSLVYSALDENGEPLEVTDRLFDDSAADYGSDFTYVRQSVSLSKDGKIVFYPEKIVDGDDGMSLYCRRVDDKDADSTLIGKNIKYYTVNDDASVVYYMKSNNALYRYNMKKGESEKIDGDVDEFEVNDDGSVIGWLTNDNDLYFQRSSGEKTKIDSSIDYVCGVFNDYKAVYYVKNDNIYMYTEKDGKEKTASNVHEVMTTYNTGEIYYIKEGQTKFTLSDYIEDDLAESDAAIVKPSYPQYPMRWEYDSNAEYDKAVEEYDAACDKYLDDLDVYDEKQQRDSMREELKTRTADYGCYELYCFDGKSEKKLCDSMMYDYSSDMFNMGFTDSPVVVYYTVTVEDVVKVKMSEVKDYNSIIDYKLPVYMALYNAKTVHVAFGQDVKDVDKRFNRSVIDDTEKKLYLFEELDGEAYPIYDAYYADISDNKLSEPELYMNRVQSLYMRDGGVYCEVVEGKTREDSREADVYFNKIKLGSNSNIMSFTIYLRNNTIYYIDDDKLMMYEDGKTVTIDENVYGIDVLESGAVVYMRDYNKDREICDLYAYKNGSSFKIDDDISALLFDVPDNFGFFD